MFEVQILIPLADNQPKSFSEREHQRFEAFVLERFRGLTLYPGKAAGLWDQDGITYSDRLRVFGIAVESIRQGGMIGEIADFVKTHYRQEAVYIRYLGQAEIL